MRIGQIAVGRKRSLRTQFSPERVLDMPILRAEIPEPWRPRRLRRAVQDRVEAPLAAFLLQCPKKPVRIRGRIRENTLQFF